MPKAQKSTDKIYLSLAMLVSVVLLIIILHFCVWTKIAEGGFIESQKAISPMLINPAFLGLILTVLSIGDYYWAKWIKMQFKAKYLFMGGAREVDNFFNEILKSLYATVTRIVFVFDYDENGREGAKMVQKLIDNGNDKLRYVFYHKQYPVPASDLDFYLEDFFERTAYNDVQLPVINGVPSFAELKKATTWANSIKNRIQKHKRDNSLTPNDYNGFKGFLEQLLLQIQ